jgi:CheY-like chemotaxis protein/HPt (histidine-containing phosphotransfer) domain-containing protein
MDLTAEQRDHVAWISRCGSSLFSFLNDILDFSKMEAGQLTLETISFDLRSMVYDAAELFRSRLAGHPVELLVDYDPGAPIQVLGDAGRLRQILNNLVSNAVKFTRQGHIRIGVRAILLAEARHRMVLSVQDTGIGIARSKQASLFDPFVQAEASTARRFGGTGLGLAIVKGLVEAMNGRITLESEEGAGSTFTVEIELQMDPSSTQESPVEAGLSGMRLLLVADVPTNLDALRRQLMGQGALLEEAVSGTAAFACIKAALDREEPFDLVVVDLIKPGDLDGDALGQAIRADARCGSTALAALTSTGFKGDPARLSRVGFNAYLLKPLPGDQLCRSLALAIQHARQTPGAEMVTRYTLMAPRVPEPQADSPQLRGRILIAEDQETNQIVLRKLLERVGATVVVAANGVEALEVVARSTFDLVLMDCQMPEMDGLEATARIRASEQGTGRHLPIIAMTAHATAENRERCLGAGMDGYLTKPIQREAILKAVADWIQVAQEHQAGLELTAGPGSLLASADPAMGLDRTLFGKLLGLYDEDAKALGQELLGPFLTSSQARLELLEQRLAENDFEALSSGAHAIKGSARTLGFTVLGALMEQLEQEAKAGAKQASETCLQEALRAFSLIREFYQQLMA